MNNKSEIIENTGKELRRLRNDRNLSLQEVAKDLKVSSMYLSEIERNKKIPSDDLIERISSIYIVEEMYLYEGFRKVPDVVLNEILNNSILFELLYISSLNNCVSKEKKTMFYKKVFDLYDEIIK